MKIYPYKRGSQSVEGLGISRIRLTDSRFRDTETVINWGSTTIPSYQSLVINKKESVRVATDKLKTYIELTKFGIKVPMFTEDVLEAIETFKRGNIVCRSILNGSGGVGIEVIHSDILNDMSDTSNFKLYSEYIKKTKEFRVHVMNGQVIHTQVKKKLRGREYSNFHVRNYSNGWVFSSNIDYMPPMVLEESILAVTALDLDFGAVDVVWNQVRGVFILEVNTAPGIEGLSLSIYKEKLMENYNDN